MDNRLVTSAAVALWAVVTLGCGASDPVPADRGGRVFRQPEWVKRFELDSGPNDTTLLYPFRPVVAETGIRIADFRGNRIVAIDTAGTVKWMHGRTGAGPGEFRRIRDLAIDSEGNAWVLDGGNNRVAVVDSSGIRIKTINLSELEFPAQRVVPLNNGQFLVHVLDTQQPFVRLDWDGHVIQKEAMPWPQLQGMNVLAAQLSLTSNPASRTWVATVTTGDGFAIYHPEASAPVLGTYVEHVEFPEIETHTIENSTVQSPTEPPVLSAISSSVSASRLYVLFGGRSKYARRIVDSYSLETGQYIETFVLPRKVDAIAWSPQGLYAIYVDPYPHLSLWQPKGASLP